MSFDLGFDVNSTDSSVALSIPYIGEGVKTLYLGSAYIPGNPIDFGVSYIASKPPTIFYPGKDIDQRLPEVNASFYIASPDRYKVTQAGRTEASLRSRLLQPGDTGIDISYLTLGSPTETQISVY